MITPRDQIVPRDVPAVLEVELERFLFFFVDPPRAGRELEVDKVGVARTNGEGLAAFDLGRLVPGTHRFRIRRGRGEWREEALVKVAPRDAPIFITDVDHTISDVSSWSYVLRPNAWVPPLEGAAAALREISRTMTVVYLSARDHIFRAKTRRWLAMLDFPEGPLYLRRKRFWSATPKEHKLEILRELRGRFTNLRWGVGDLKGDIEAYAECGIPPILIGPRPLPDLPSGARHARSWREIADMIK